METVSDGGGHCKIRESVPEIQNKAKGRKRRKGIFRSNKFYVFFFC